MQKGKDHSQWSVARRHAVLTMAALASLHGSAMALELDTGNEDAKVRWDNTIQYSNAFRVRNQNQELLANPNGDDGDRNFGKGLISNRVDLLTEFEASWKNVGMRVSAAAWYDSVYNRSNDNNSPATANSLSVPFNQFTDATRKLHGNQAEILDAYVYGKTSIGDAPVTFRLGKHTLLWGESLFFADNGIAAAQAPVDVIKAASVPNTEAKELLMPVGQVSGQIQLQDGLTLAGYYQYQWKKNRLPAAGSYFSSADLLDAGGERLLAGPGAYFLRNGDQAAPNTGQGGLSVHFRPQESSVEYGLYALRYNDKNPQVYLHPGVAPDGSIINPSVVNLANGQIGEYSLAYGQGIKLYGASFSTTLGGANVAGEVSVRRDTPLVSTAQAVLPGMTVNGDSPLFAIGNSAHAQVSAIYALPPTWFAKSTMFAGELAWNRLTSITKNAAAFDQTRNRDAWSMRFVLTPQYFRVYPDWDISFPIGVGYTPRGKSSVDPAFGADRSGDVSVGVNATYQQVWQFAMNGTHYYGPTDAQVFKDRDFVTFSVRRTF